MPKCLPRQIGSSRQTFRKELVHSYWPSKPRRQQGGLRLRVQSAQAASRPPQEALQEQELDALCAVSAALFPAQNAETTQATEFSTLDAGEQRVALGRVRRCILCNCKVRVGISIYTLTKLRKAGADIVTSQAATEPPRGSEEVLLAKPLLRALVPVPF